MRTTSYVLIVLAVCLTILSGILHGRISGRWKLSRQNQQMAERLTSLPEQIGEWQLRESREMSEEVQTMLECQGYLYRDYINQSTGELVSVVVLLGPHGPISVHTPEICYSSRDFTALNERVPATIDSPDGSKSEFWKLTFESNNKIENEQMNVYYAWTTDGQWQAASNPRISFIGSPFLLKIQLASVLPLGSTSTGDGACHRFLQLFVPVLKEQLFPGN